MSNVAERRARRHARNSEKKSRVPSLRHHKASGQGYVVLNGRGRYNMSVFKDRHFRFVTDPADRVEAVQVRQLDLALRRDPWKRVILSAVPSRGYPRPVYELREHVTARDELSLDALEVTKAKLRLVFVPDDDGRGKRLTFEVGWPDRCTLRDGRYDQVARRCLKRWGVDCA